MNATSLGCLPSSAIADLSAERTPKSPQPGHHHDGVAVAKSLGVKVAVISEDLHRLADHGDALNRLDDLDRPEGPPVVLAHAAERIERPHDRADPAPQPSPVAA